MKNNSTALWDFKKISEVCTIIGGGTPKRENPEYFNGSIVWLTPTEIDRTEIRFVSDSREKITQSGLSHSAAKLIPTGSVLLTTRATIGNIAISGTELTTNQGFASLVCSKTLNNKYLAYWLKSEKDQLIARSKGTTFKEISKAELKNFVIPIPPISTQHAIVEKLEALFSELDKGIEQLKTAQQQLRIYQQAVLKAAFEGRLTGELKKGVELPHGWKKLKVKDICDVVRGGSPRPAGDPKFYGGTIPFLKVRDITKDNFMYLRDWEFSIKEAGLKKTRLIHPNTLLLSNSGATLGVPKICLITATINDGIAAFLNLDGDLNSYMYYFWKSKTKELRDIVMVPVVRTNPA